MENKTNERFFAELAQAYAENEGAALQQELAELVRASGPLPTPGLERKIKRALSAYKFRAYALRALPVAASLLVAVLLYSSLGGLPGPASETQPPPFASPVAEEPAAPSDNAPTYEAPGPLAQNALRHSVKLVSASLPAGYTLTGVDYDNEAAIMEITNGQNNRIVLVTEAYHDFDKEGFSVITVNGVSAYGLVKKDYCLLKYAKDDMLYTLTSMYDYGDLLEIIENI
jgi:hypothetical protein